MESILLIGGGGHCKSVIDVIEQEGRFNIVGIVDQPELMGTRVLDYTVIANDEDLPRLIQQYKYACITVGQIKTPYLRIELFNILKKIGFILPSLVSPRAYMSKNASIGDGSVVMHDALINAGARIGRNCIINTKALIEHDSIVADNCHVSTGAIINGGVSVGGGSFIGSHAITKQGISIEANSFIKAGSLVK